MVKVIVGGVLEIVTVRLRYGGTAELAELAEPLLEWMLPDRSPAVAAEVARARAELSVSAAGAVPDPQRAPESVAGPLGRLPLWRDESVRPISIREPRARIIAAAAQIASDRGYAALSINEITRAAAVSHHTFRKHFQTKQEAFVAAYREGSRATIEYSLKATRPHPTGGRPSTLALQPSCASSLSARLWRGSASWRATPPARSCTSCARPNCSCSPGASPGYRETRRSVPPHAVVAEAIAGGIYQLMRECILDDGPERLPDLLSEVTYAALAPFTGAKAAASAAVRLVSIAE